MAPKRTPFHEKHLELNGKMVDFTGWHLPVQYDGIITEVKNTRQNAGIFDVTHMGEILVGGRSAASFLNRVLTNDIAGLKPNQIIYSPLCYEDGGTVDDILVYNLGGGKFLLVVNAINREKDYNWLSKHAGGDTVLYDVSDEFAQIALQGPHSLEILLTLADKALTGLKYYHFLPEVSLAGIKCLVSRTGYTGEDGFEIYCPHHEARELWGEIWSAGQESGLGLAAAGLGARDILRLEASLPLYGHELSETLTPLNAGLDRFVSFTKEVNFIGRESLLKQKAEGLKTKLCGLVMSGRGIAREGYEVRAGEDTGWISSGSFSPTLEKSIALAFLKPDSCKAGSQVQVMIRGREYSAQVVKIPFYRRGI